jgi:hypothetical protein
MFFEGIGTFGTKGTGTTGPVAKPTKKPLVRGKPTKKSKITEFPP